MSVEVIRMIVQAPRRKVTALTIVAAMVLLAGQAPGAVIIQTPNVQELASKMTGSWRVNKELSPGLSNSGRGREGRRGMGPTFGVMLIAAQRGGRGGGGGGGGAESGANMAPLVPAEVAAQAALSIIQQVPLELTIEATPAEIKVTEPRGQSVFRIDGKNAPIEVPGGTIKVKSKWDKASLRQEFSSTQRMLVRSWSVDSNGRLVLAEHIESVTFKSKETQAVFDKQ
jgi:hypothetical protein